MRKTFTTLALTLILLAALDAGVAGLLAWAERNDRFRPLVEYFDYGLSVPGKHARWIADPDMPGNLHDVAWLEAGVALSAAEFGEAAPGTGPVIRSYGMSFVNNILEQARALDPSLILDIHAGPGAPPNYTYAFFLDDRQNRHPGDIAVLGVLSSSLPAMTALSNQTWVFEQPAPFTYPIFRSEGAGGLTRVDPVIRREAQHRALSADPGLARDWAGQLAAEDAFYGPVTHGLVWLDRSPFARLVRRASAIGHIERVEQRIFDGAAYPYPEVLARMIAEFARIARADGQVPVVMLVQSRDPRAPDLLEMTAPVLERHDIPYLATTEHADIRNPAVFRPDGHYIPEVDRRFGQAFLDLIAEAP
jgi:hypothetical protein